MKKYTLVELDLLIARAKTTGDQIWYQLKALDGLMGDSRETSYDRFANMCDAYEKEFTDTQLGSLLAIEIFLRAGKHIPASIKIANRTKADKLKETILRRNK